MIYTSTNSNYITYIGYNLNVFCCHLTQNLDVVYVRNDSAVFTKYYQRHQIKEHEMSMICDSDGELKNAYK